MSFCISYTKKTLLVRHLRLYHESQLSTKQKQQQAHVLCDLPSPPTSQYGDSSPYYNL